MLRRICKFNIKPIQAFSNHNVQYFSSLKQGSESSDPRIGKYEPGKKREPDTQQILEKEALESNKRYIEKKWLTWSNKFREFRV